MLNLSSIAFHHKRVWDRRWGYDGRGRKKGDAYWDPAFWDCHKRAFELILLHKDCVKCLMTMTPNRVGPARTGGSGGRC